MPDKAPDGEPTGARGGILRRVLYVSFVLIAMGVSATVGGYAILLLTLRGHEVTVPNLIQMTKPEAEAEAARRDLKVEVAGSRVEPRVGEGRIFEQDPPAGATTRPQRTVKVLLSLGQASLEVPALVGEPIRKAQLTLEQLGLRIGHLANVPSLDQPVDEVLSQRPAPGARRQKGDAIDLLVSRGAPERVYVMPALRGLAVERANEILKDVGVRVGLSRRAEGPQSGVVLDQSPREGFPLREHQTVQLVVTQ